MRGPHTKSRPSDQFTGCRLRPRFRSLRKPHLGSQHTSGVQAGSNLTKQFGESSSSLALEFHECTRPDRRFRKRVNAALHPPLHDETTRLGQGSRLLIQWDWDNHFRHAFGRRRRTSGRSNLDGQHIEQAAGRLPITWKSLKYLPGSQHDCQYNKRLVKLPSLSIPGPARFPHNLSEIAAKRSPRC